MHVVFWILRYGCNPLNYKMILTTLTLSVSVIAFSIFIALNPLTIGIIILFIALLLSLTFAYSMSSWVAFLIFLIYIGGMLVIFSYFVSIIPNQTLEVIFNISIIITSISTLFITSLLLIIKPIITVNQPIILNYIYLKFNLPILIILASILLFTIIVVVKITILSKGPLRPFIAYV